jgi:hypothetical protein
VGFSVGDVLTGMEVLGRNLKAITEFLRKNLTIFSNKIISTSIVSERQFCPPGERFVAIVLEKYSRLLGARHAADL